MEPHERAHLAVTVEVASRIAEGCLIVAVRCHYHPVRRATVFNRVYRSVARNPTQPLGLQGEKWIDGRDVWLAVERIVAYGHELEELSQGMTAELHLLPSSEGPLLRDEVLAFVPVGAH